MKFLTRILSVSGGSTPSPCFPMYPSVFLCFAVYPPFFVFLFSSRFPFFSCFPMVSYVSPCFPMYPSVFLCFAVFSNALPCFPMFSSASPFIPMFSNVFPCFLMFSPAFLYFPLHPPFFLCFQMFSPVFLCFIPLFSYVHVSQITTQVVETSITSNSQQHQSSLSPGRSYSAYLCSSCYHALA